MNVVSAIRERVLSWAGQVARMDYSEICAMQATRKYMMFWIKQDLLLEVWSLYRQAALAARASCEQVLLDGGSRHGLVLFCHRIVATTRSDWPLGKAWQGCFTAHV